LQSNPNSDVHLGGGEHGLDLALGVARPMMSALPLGRPMDLGTHGGVFSLSMEGRCQMDLGTKVTDRSAPRKICGKQHTDPVTQVDGSVMMEVLLLLVSTVSGRGR
jgi:hypothetical protein